MSGEIIRENKMPLAVMLSSIAVRMFYGLKVELNEGYPEDAYSFVDSPDKFEHKIVCGKKVYDELKSLPEFKK